MTVVTTHPPGEPTWVDLMTSDPDGARAFYGGLFDWTFDIGTPETFGYTMCFKGGHRVAGMGQKPPDMPMPTCWNVYLGTADVDATCEAIRQGGGTIVQPPMDIMEEGRMAFATDPTGAAFGLWQPRKHGGTQLVDEPGSFAWCELNTRDLAGAQAFLCELFGYEAREVPIPVTKYVTLHLAGHDEPIGGILQMNETGRACRRTGWRTSPRTAPTRRASASPRSAARCASRRSTRPTGGSPWSRTRRAGRSA